MSGWIETGPNGSQLLTVDTPGLILGRKWSRNAPVGNGGDRIAVTGLTSITHDPRGENVEAVLVVTTLDMDDARRLDRAR